MQERVRLAGGSLSVYSAPGKGTRIDLRVPLLEEPLRPEADHKMTSGVAAS
jgi:signal transduction histidine kinase